MRRTSAKSLKLVNPRLRGWRVPAFSAGAVATIWPAEVTVNEAAFTLPNCTAAAPVKLLPLMVITAPPDQYYKPDGEWVDASPSLLRSRTLTRLQPGKCRSGAIYTTAALFAEGEADVERWFREGFAAVDMETAATYAVAEHFGMDRIAILYGFDNPRRREHCVFLKCQSHPATVVRDW